MRHILRIVRDRFAAGAIDTTCQDGAKFMEFKRMGQTTEAYQIEFDVSRETAEERMVMGGGFPGDFVPFLCTQHAPLTENGKSLPPASIQNTLEFPAAANQTR